MGFAQGVSGLNAASQALDVIGNNISNSQTVGFKSGSASFADIFAGSRIGLGVKVAGINQNFSDGTIASSGNSLDMALQGNGFFRMQDDAGSVYYSRNGQFQKDKDGYIVNNQGMFLTGYQATGTPPKIQQGSDVGPIRIPSDGMPASASTSGKITGNLCSEDKAIVDDAGNPIAFDPTKDDTYNFKSQVSAYDSLGNKHTINLYYQKTGPNEWKVYSCDATSPLGGDANNLAAYKTVDLKFDASGNMTPKDVKIPVEGKSYNGANALNFDTTLNFTQNSEKDGTTENTTNGYAPGTMIGYQIDEGGLVTASYSNGEKQTIAQVVLASFANNGGLDPQGNNCWKETSASGQPVLGLSGTGTMGTLYGQAVEASNVDMSQELVSMMIQQRNYQSNSQTIKTQDQLLQTLVNLR